MNKREAVLSVIGGATAPAYVPAAFFMHFDPAYHRGQAAIDKHLEYFRYTGMDFVKIQYEQPNPPAPPIRTPQDWAHVPRCNEAFFEPVLEVVRGLVAAAKSEALVVMTVYSPFMWAKHYVKPVDLAAHLQENPEAVKKGLEIMTDNVLTLLRGCKRAGIDGFYTSTQGGEAFRFGGTDIFRSYIRPTDLAVWDEIKSCTFNILHVCDYDGGYDDLTPFLDYPGHVINCSLTAGGQTLTPTSHLDDVWAAVHGRHGAQGGACHRQRRAGAAGGAGGAKGCARALHPGRRLHCAQRLLGQPQSSNRHCSSLALGKRYSWAAAPPRSFHVLQPPAGIASQEPAVTSTRPAR